jgi:hypothetical protein
MVAGVELVGATVELDLPELGAVGPALVVDVRPCPAIPAGPGQVATGTLDLGLWHGNLGKGIFGTAKSRGDWCP